MKKSSAALAALAFVAMLAWTTVAIAQPVPVEPGTLPISEFPSAQSCVCHADRQAEWSQSMHAKAIKDPVFLSKRAQADKETKGAVTPFCNKCHAPAAVMAGEFAPGKQLSQSGAEGVACSFCHQVTGTNHPIGNVSQLVEPGPRRAQLKDAQAPHAWKFSEFSSTGEFCGSCHDVLHPGNGMHLESTYAEWKKSPYAAKGVTCQNCHMGTASSLTAPFQGQAANGGPTRDNIFAMTFAGANVAQGNPELSTAQLKRAATVTIDAPEVVAAGTPTTATVTVTNVGAGHSIPGGLSEVRQMWLTVSLVSADGTKKVLKEHTYGTVLKDAKGNHPVEFWNAAGVYSDDRIAPEQSKNDKVAVKLPAGADKADLVAELNYKSMDDALAKQSGVENPTTLMASAQQTIYGSAAAKSAAQQATQSAPAAPTSGTPKWLPWAVIGAILAVGAGLLGFYLARRK